jgi:glycosyltransferase involved in cell wall biosynthesis
MTIAVLIPVYNGQAALDRTLESLAAEETAFDVVVVDDGSRVSVVVPAEIGSHRVVLLTLPANQGIEGALNTGLRLILERNYTYVARLDAADRSLPGRFAAQSAFLEAHPDYALVGAQAEAISREGRPLYVMRPPSAHEGILRSLRYSNCFVHPAVMMRVAALREVGLYRRTYPAAEDYDLFYRLADRYKVAILDQVLVQFEVGADGISASRRAAQLRSRFRIQWQHFELGDPHAYLGLFTSAILFVTPQQVLTVVKRLAWR